jgi:DNA-binding beta-propeller fold protein YncE
MKPFDLVPFLSLLIILSKPISTHGAENKPHFNYVPNHFDSPPAQTDRPASIGPCHGGAVIDKAGDVYVTTDTPRGILIYNSSGKFQRAVGPSHIHALEIREENGTEFIYAARPTAHEVIKLTLTGEKVWTLNYPQESGLYKDAMGFNPCAVTVAPDGSIFVADGYGSNYVLKFDKNRKFLKAFGGPGEAEGKFKTCHGIAFDPRHNNILVCNRNNNRVEHWDLDGNFIRVIQKDLRMPAAVHIRGDYALFPELEGRVTLLDRSGSIAAQLGDQPNPKHRANYGLPQTEWKPGIVNSPHGGSIDKDGNIIISEWTQFGRLHRWTRSK